MNPDIINISNDFDDINYYNKQNKFDNTLDIIENLKNKLLNYIATIMDNKKQYVCKFILECCEIIKEIEVKIEQEKLSYEMLLDEKIQNEKIIYSNVTKSNHKVTNNFEAYYENKRLYNLEIKMKTFMNDFTENFNIKAYQLDHKLNLLRNNIFNIENFNLMKLYVFDDSNKYSIPIPLLNPDRKAHV